MSWLDPASFIVISLQARPAGKICMFEDTEVVVAGWLVLDDVIGLTTLTTVVTAGFIQLGGSPSQAAGSGLAWPGDDGQLEGGPSSQSSQDTNTELQLTLLGQQSWGRLRSPTPGSPGCEICDRTVGCLHGDSY